MTRYLGRNEILNTKNIEFKSAAIFPVWHELPRLENRRKINKLTLLYKTRNNLLCIKENGYLESADSRTRDASRNYKLKSAKSELF